MDGAALPALYRLGERVIEGLSGCTGEASFIVHTLQFKLACPTPI
jgi:hypothetical protein